jgi:hypothetical protein
VLLCQLFLGLPLFLEPCGFHIRAALQGSWSLSRNVWPIHLNLRRLISILTFSWLVSFQRFSFEMTLGHQNKYKTLHKIINFCTRWLCDCSNTISKFRASAKFKSFIKEYIRSKHNLYV